MREKKTMRRLSGVVCGACIFANPSLAQAQEATQEPGGTRARIDISTGAEVSSNPFLTEDGSEAASAYIAIDPSVFLEDGRHETVLRGSFRLSQYTNGYGQDESASARIESNRALSERTNLGLRASIQSARSNFRSALSDLAASSLANGPGGFPEPADLDPTIIGTRGRTTSITTSASIEHVLSPVDAFQVAASFQNNQYDDAAGNDHTDVSLLLGYSRQLTPRTAISLRGQVSLTNYEEPTGGNANAFGDANVYLLSGQVEHAIDNQWEFKAGIGVNLIDQDLGQAGGESDVFLAADAALCRNGLQTRFCATATRSANPTARSGVTNVTSIGLSSEFRFSEVDTFSVSSYFGRAEEDRANLLVTDARPRNVLGGAARFRHNLSDRASLLIQSSYSDIESSERDVAADFSVSLGISLRLGSTY